MKQLILLLILLTCSTKVFSQDYHYSVGLNAYRVNYEFIYLQPPSYYDTIEDIDTLQFLRHAIGPEFRMWYSHEFSTEFSLIAGLGASCGFTRNALFLELPVFVGGDYSPKEGIAYFGDIGFSFSNSMTFGVMKTVYGNIELGIRKEFEIGTFAFKVRAGSLLYQNYEWGNLPFEQEDIILLKSGILCAGISYMIDFDLWHLERAY